MIRRIRDLLYDQGFTISGARNRLQELVQADRQLQRGASDAGDATDAASAVGELNGLSFQPFAATDIEFAGAGANSTSLHKELIEIRALLTL